MSLSVALAGPSPAIAAASRAHPARAAQRAQLARARALWSAQDVHSYRFRLRIACDCGAAAARPLEITVRDRRPVDAEYFPGQLQSVTEMFRLIAQVLDDPRAGAVTVRYDPRRGFPRSAALDSIDWTVDRFAVL